MVMTALSEFGLVEKHQKGLRLTELAGKILRPLSNDDLIANLRAAFLSSPFSKEVYEACRESGQVPQALHVLLERNHGILPQAAKLAADVFKQSLYHAYLADSDGRFVETDFDETVSEDDVDDLPEDTNDDVPDVARVNRIQEKNDEPIHSVERAFTHSLVMADLGCRVQICQPSSIEEAERVVKWFELVVKPWLDFTLEPSLAAPMQPSKGGEKN